jgi:hypothetical protein
MIRAVLTLAASIAAVVALPLHAVLTHAATAIPTLP